MVEASEQRPFRQRTCPRPVLLRPSDATRLELSQASAELSRRIHLQRLLLSIGPVNKVRLL